MATCLLKYHKNINIYSKHRTLTYFSTKNNDFFFSKMKFHWKSSILLKSSSPRASVIDSALKTWERGSKDFKQVIYLKAFYGRYTSVYISEGIYLHPCFNFKNLYIF